MRIGEIPPLLGKNVRYLRKLSAISGQALARMLGVAPCFIRILLEDFEGTGFSLSAYMGDFPPIEEFP